MRERLANKAVRIWAAAVYVVSLGVFAYFARDLFPGEVTFSTWVQSGRSSWLDATMTAISAPGVWVFSVPIVASTVAVLFLKGHRIESALITVAALAANGANYIIKAIVGRPRPTDDLVQTMQDFHGFAFPSGHVVHHVVFLGTLVVMLTWAMKPGLARRLICGGLVLALVAIGLSRIYLGAHYVGDVFGGYLFGAGMVAFFIALWRMWLDRAPGAPAESPSMESATV